MEGTDQIGPQECNGQAARESAIKTVIIGSVESFPNDAICITIVHDLVTSRCHMAGSTCPEDIAKHVSEMAHKCIDDWYNQNSKN